MVIVWTGINPGMIMSIGFNFKVMKIFLDYTEMVNAHCECTKCHGTGHFKMA